MKKFLLLGLIVSNVSFATCVMLDQGPAQCNNGTGNGQNVSIKQSGIDACPGKRVVTCPKKKDVSLQIDFLGKEDRCVKTQCHAPGGGGSPVESVL